MQVINAPLWQGYHLGINAADTSETPRFAWQEDHPKVMALNPSALADRQALKESLWRLASSI